MTDARYVLWICGRIDPRYGDALYGVIHAAVDGDGRTLCGQRAVERETKTTMWWAGDYGRPYRDPDPTCNACRRKLGLEPVRESTVML